MKKDDTIWVAVKTIIVNEGKVLLLRRTNNDSYAGLWEFCGGRLELGETLEEALLREVREETGLTIAIKRLLYATTVIISPKRQMVLLNYLSTSNTNKVFLSDEHQDYLWATRTEVESMINPEIQKDLLKHGIYSQIPFTS